MLLCACQEINIKELLTDMDYQIITYDFTFRVAAIAYAFFHKKFISLYLVF